MRLYYSLTGAGLNLSRGYVDWYSGFTVYCNINLLRILCYILAVSIQHQRILRDT